MSLHKCSKKCIVSYIVLFFLVLFVMLAIAIHRSVQSHLSELCRYKCGEIVNRMLSETTLDNVNDDEYYYVQRAENGKIISVEANTALLNRIQNNLRKQINEKLSTNGYDMILLTLGDLTDIAYFSGRGPEISIRFQQSGIADTRIETSFDSTGINQSRLMVKIVISVEFTAFLPSGEENILITDDYIAADKIIVGDLPEYLIQNPVFS